MILALVVAGGAVGGFLLLGDESDNGGTTSGATLEGDGYSYAMPDGWEDVSGELASGAVDTISRAEAAEEGFRSNVLVEVHPAQGTTDVEELRSTWESNVGNAVGGTPEEIDSTTIDGQDAVGIRVESNQQGTEVVQVVYLAINNDKVYSIALSTGAGVEEDATATFEELLGNWSWQ